MRELTTPFAGSHNSAVGREGGNSSLDCYCDVKNVAATKESFVQVSFCLGVGV